MLGAGLVVCEEEPKVPEALLSRFNAVLLPPTGSASVKTCAATGQLVVSNLVAG